MRSSFFRTIEITAADADHIAAAVLGALNNADIPTTNVIGFAADTTKCNVWMQSLCVDSLEGKDS